MGSGRFGRTVMRPRMFIEDSVPSGHERSRADHRGVYHQAFRTRRAPCHPPRMSPRLAHRVVTAFLTVVLLGVVAGRAVGQEAELRLALGAEAEDAVRAALLGVEGGGLELDLALTAGPDPGAALAVQRRRAAGVLGTLVLEVEGAVRLAAPAAARATLR